MYPNIKVQYFYDTDMKSLKIFLNEQKRLKTAQKSVLTSFRVQAKKDLPLGAMLRHFKQEKSKKKQVKSLIYRHISKINKY